MGERRCPWCGTGTGVLLGLLGCRAHYRCRNCGGEFSTTDHDIDYYRGDPEEADDNDHLRPAHGGGLRAR